MEDVDRLSPSDGAKRNALMKTGLDYLAAGEDKTAFVALSSVLRTYPNDLFVLRYTAAAAMGAGQNDQALLLFRRALALLPHNPWPMRNAVIILEARLNKWDEFDRDMVALRQAKKNGNDHALDGSTGFVIDGFDAGAEKVQGAIYPMQTGKYHTLYRFLLPKEGEVALPGRTSAETAASAKCTNADFQPHLDLESADVDQAAFAKAHPEKAAKGERSYMLDAYVSPCVQKLVWFYPDGEPTYEQARADALKVLTGKR
jgi:tetratricopeptide (TPR) repeat protein